MITAALLNARSLLDLGAAVSRERKLLLGEATPADAAAAVHKLTRINSVSMALAADVPALSRNLRMASLELHAAEAALWRDQTVLASQALGNALMWLDAARLENGGIDREGARAVTH